jgi:uncharacterized protein YndB with AHSA1/START domain
MQQRVQINAEFIFRASPTMIYKFLTTPTCLIRWFCDEVDNAGDEFTFKWGNSEEVAILLDDIEDERVRFHWVDAEDGEFLEFKMYRNDVTNETVVEIIDFADKGDEKSQHQVWTSQMEDLRRAVGG